MDDLPESGDPRARSDSRESGDPWKGGDRPPDPGADAAGEPASGAGETESASADGVDPGRYRRRDGIRRDGRLLVNERPLLVTRLNPAAVGVVDALPTDRFLTPEAVATRTGADRGAVAALLWALHRRGFLEWRPARDPAHAPPVSVVVTVRDAADDLRGCLDALAALEYPEYEVVVVDDGSTDGTPAVAREHSLAADGGLRVVAAGSPDDPVGIGVGRNRGVRAAAHDVVAFTDADCRPRPDWLAELVPCLAAHDVVGGRVRPYGPSTDDSREVSGNEPRGSTSGDDSRQAADDSRQAAEDPRGSTASAYEGANSSLDMGPRGARVRRGGATPYLPTANLVGRADVFRRVGFPERNVAEDVAFCWEAVAAGFDVVYEPAGVVDHDYDDGARAFAARRAAYGASEALLAREFPPAGSVGLPRGSLAVAAVALLAALLVAVSPDVAGVVPFGPVAAGLAAGGLVAGVLAALAGGRVLRRAWGVVPARTALASLGRRALSATYAASLELTRYYAFPLAALAAGLLAVGGSGSPPAARTTEAPPTVTPAVSPAVAATAGSSPAAVTAGGLLAALLVAVVALPSVVEYALRRPACSPLAYARWYLLDHLAYQYGVYRGAITHRTVAHLDLRNRFSWGRTAGGMWS